MTNDLEAEPMPEWPPGEVPLHCPPEPNYYVEANRDSEDDRFWRELIADARELHPDWCKCQRVCGGDQ